MHLSVYFGNLKINSPNFRTIFFHCKRPKNRFCHILGEFFKNSSGHSVQNNLRLVTCGPSQYIIRLVALLHCNCIVNYNPKYFWLNSGRIFLAKKFQKSATTSRLIWPASFAALSLLQVRTYL
jgi:hypothetical protein